jgi:DNA-binding NtrC family response regulator
MRQIDALLTRIAPTAATLLIEGETGTGKEWIARALHERSPRAQAPFVVVDCAALAGALLESELFGHERGSFSGAVRVHQGLFEQAQGGTLFLDEIGGLGLELQPKLLRVLEQREIRRLGAQTSLRLDVRVVAATSRDLGLEVRRGRFREDLFYRLSVVRVRVPPLRERPTDLPLLVDRLLRAASADDRGADRTPFQLEEAALDLLRAAPWPGNVRQLANVLQRARLRGSGRALRHGDVLEALEESSGSAAEGSEGLLYLAFRDARRRVLASFESTYLSALIARSHGNLSRAARDSEIDRKHLRRLLRRHAIAHPAGRASRQRLS